MNSSRKAFTLVELLIFLGIFAGTSAAFITILITVTRVQVRQASVADVSEQSQFLLQQVQYYISRSSLVDIPQDTPTSTLRLLTGIAAQDPTYITLASGTVYLQQTATGTLQALTSNKLTVSDLTFTRRANVPAHDAVSVSFTLAYNTVNLQQAFSQMLQTSVARVSAATFDSNILPSTSTTLNLGLSGQIWNSINQSIYFNGANVGIGMLTPLYALDVAGGLRVSQTSTFSGNVGIGTINPTAPLTIQSILNGQGLTINGASGVSPTIRLTNNGTQIGKFAAIANANDFLPGTAVNDVLIGNDNATGKLHLFGGGNSIKMTIDQTGFVGIGTISPSSTLEVNGTTTIDIGGSANHLMCWGSNGKTLGYCTGGVVTSTGACTCSN